MTADRRPRILSACTVVAALVLTLAGCVAPAPKTPTAIILMIGDGMGIAQITFARNLLLSPGERWAFEELPTTALVSTRSASNLTTDSGAAATAMSTGVKTSNLRIGTTAEGESPQTLAEAAQASGWRVGFVTTTAVTHATPAAFYSHVGNRYGDVDDIGAQLLEHQPDVVLGGGLGLPENGDGERGDESSFVREAEARGYTVWSRGSDRSGRPERLMGLLASEHFNFRLDDRRNAEDRRDPSLAELTRIALDILSRDGEPFFLMVEGGRIDHASHSFDAPTSAYEVEDFSDAVAVVREFGEQNPASLMIVTADHATGGLAINDYADWDGLRRQRASVEWMAEQIRHAGAGVEMVREMTGYEGLTEDELELVRTELDKYEAWRHLGRLLSRHNGITWVPRVGENTKGHTGEDVPLFAAGFGAERFQGVLDNTEIARRLMEIGGFAGRSPDLTE